MKYFVLIIISLNYSMCNIIRCSKPNQVYHDQNNEETDTCCTNGCKSGCYCKRGFKMNDAGDCVPGDPASKWSIPKNELSINQEYFLSNRLWIWKHGVSVRNVIMWRLVWNIKRSAMQFDSVWLHKYVLLQARLHIRVRYGHLCLYQYLSQQILSAYSIKFNWRKWPNIYLSICLKFNIKFIVFFPTGY